MNQIKNKTILLIIQTLDNRQKFKRMIKLTAQLGSNPLRYHTPIKCRSWGDYFLTIGESGEIVGWRISTMTPLYQIICSALADTDGLIDLIITPLRLITNELQSLKIIAAHNDDRIRIFTLQDGICKNVSQHGVLPQKVIGLVENQNQSRFLLSFGEKTVYIIDAWSLKVVDCIQPMMDSFSILKRGRVTKKHQLQLMDRQSKTYRINLNYLFEQTHLDVGNWLSNPIKAARLLSDSIQKIKKQAVINSYRKIVDQDFGEQLEIVNNKLEQIKRGNLWEDILDIKHHNMEIINFLIDLNDREYPVVSNCFFMNYSKLWYFFGTNKGRLIGVPVITKQENQVVLSNPEGEINSAVAYLSFLHNFIIVSWENGMFAIYKTDHFQYAIQTSLSEQKNNNTPNSKYKNLCFVDLNNHKSKIFSEKLSSQIKYRLQIYSVGKGKLDTQMLAFHLINNEVIVFQTIHKKLSHYRGVPQDLRIYAVLEMKDYFGIVHNKGIDVYSVDRFERTIEYDQWIWSDQKLCEQFKCKDDYHNIYSKVSCQNAQTDLSSVNAMMMFEYSERFYNKKLDYYSPSEDLLYETFGPLESQKISNQLYPQIHFIQRVYSQRTLHSHCTENATSIIRLKHNNIRRQKLTNTTYLYSCNLNKQLQSFSNDKQAPIKQFEKNFSLFSLFFWDEDQTLHVSKLFNQCKLKFLMKRRFTLQGIGRSFTIYFDNKFKNNLSSELITYSSISTISLLEVCSYKDNEITEEMANAVYYYTMQRNSNSIKVDVQTLSRISISESPPILKTCIHILMSTALTQIVSLHPTYQYFILNLKNMQETKNRALTQTQTIWFVYLGIGFIFSNQAFDKQQVGILIERLIQTIEIKNFELRPDLIQIILKVFKEGIKKWKYLVNSEKIIKIFVDLFRIFFYYDAVNIVLQDDKKFNFCFYNVPQPQRKKMKQQIFKTIQFLSKQFNNQFLKIIKNQAVNQKIHCDYPASVIEILKQYIKTEKPQTNLMLFVELLLQCLSPITPQLRKHVQKNVLATLPLMCSYENISFNKPSQKLSLHTDSNIYIYCLRTSTRWRTISLKEQNKIQHTIIQMSPQGNYIAFLGERLRVWRLNSGFWSGVVGAFSQGWTFEAKGISLKWDEKEQSITVINENPSLNKEFKL